MTAEPPNAEQERMRMLLCDLQNHLRSVVLGARNAGTAESLAGVADITAADTIYQVDKISESAISDWFTAHWPPELPVELVMEGMEDQPPTTFPAGTPVAATAWKCILDPIDGTRNLMYDKRSAWALAGIAPQKGSGTRLQDIVVAVMTELPPSKQWRSDQLSAVRGKGMRAEAHDIRSGETVPLALQPSRASDCRHGFACLSRFFPDGLGLLGRIEEALWKELYPEGSGGSPLVFNDQYITTAGQLYEIVAGHDRFIADLRPLAFKKLGLSASLSTHPYDLAAALVAEEAGVVLEDPLTHQPVNPPLDTTTPVSWAAYANGDLAAHVRPALSGLLAELI
jgi:fructose-1,6-bisphosphatase/inositol monophosphatase family enzyme